MREIKFRAWDKCNERMVESRNVLKICMSRLNQQPYLIIYLKKWMNENREIREMDKCYTNEFILMQYTGFKDRNEKEIYEGDILKAADNDPLTFVVRWREYGGFNLLGINGQAFEVIGNIYENPELIQG